jgi:hypothetical protein
MARTAMTRRRRDTRLACLVTGWLAASSAVAGVAAGGAGAATAPGHRVTVTKGGFSLVLPAGWNQVSLSGSNVGTLIGVPNVAPSIQSALTTQAKYDAAKNLKFFAVPLSQLNGTFLPVINVGSFVGSGSRAVLDPEIRGFISEASASNVKIKNVHLRLGKAVEGTYELFANSTTTLPVWETQVYAPHAGRVYVATFSALTEPAVELTAAVVMDSWRFLPKS